MQLPASKRRKKALQFLGKLKLEIIKSAEFLDNIRSVRQCDTQYVSVLYDQAIGWFWHI